MADLVARLRVIHDNISDYVELTGEAAERIEELEAELDQLALAPCTACAERRKQHAARQRQHKARQRQAQRAKAAELNFKG